MAGLKNDKGKEKDNSVAVESKETKNSTETNVNTETGKTEIVTQNQEAIEVKAEKFETKKEDEDKTYIYVDEELTKDGFILKHKGFYTSEQLKKIEIGLSNYDEIKESFIDLEIYSKDR